jgi:REP element-mobilizing transposase RayT
MRGAFAGGVTSPRQGLAGRSYLVTRRCSERRFFLRPSRRTTDLVRYVLVAAAQRYDILVHAFCVLSNHLHLVVTDQHANLPAFMQYFDSVVARSVNASLGRFEGFRASASSYSAVVPLDPADVVAKAAYALANPVAAGLVRFGAEWPGLRSSPAQIGSTLVARRPKFFFDEKGYVPEAVELELTPPPGFASAGAFADALAEAVADLELQHRRRVEATGLGFLGVARVLAQKPFAHPAPGEPRFKLNPRVAARDKWKRIEALSSLKSFLAEYRAAWASFRAGVRTVVFPAGTYLLRVLHGAQSTAGGRPSSSERPWHARWARPPPGETAAGP